MLCRRKESRVSTARPHLHPLQATDSSSLRYGLEFIMRVCRGASSGLAVHLLFLSGIMNLSKSYFAAATSSAMLNISNPFVIHFDDVPDATEVLDHYSSHGVYFSPEAEVFMEAHLGGHGYFSDEPSCPNAVTHPGTSYFTMNVPGN